MRYSAVDTMTCDLVKTSVDESLETAYLKMKDHNIRHLPVQDQLGNIIGIVSDRDIFRGMQPDLRDYQSFLVEGVDFDPKAKVRDFMSWPVKTVDYTTDLRVVVGQMINDKVSALLVTHEKSIVGIVTSHDLLKLLFELLGDNFLSLEAPAKEKHWIGTLLRIAK